MASNKARKSAEKNKRNYDLKVRETTLEVGDRVLVRQVGLRRKYELADRWEKTPYVVIEIPNSDVPVFKVQKESDTHVVRTLHRNMLLPFTAISGKLEVPEPTVKPLRRKIFAKRVQDKVSENSSESDQSDTDSVLPSLYPVLQPRRRYNSNTSQMPSLITGTDPRFELSNSFSDHGSLHTKGAPNVIDVSDRSSANTIRTDSGQSNSTQPSEQPVHYPPVPRRSNRVRNDPDRFGEWVSGQISVDNPDTQEYFV